MWDYYLYNITINRNQIIGIVAGVTGMLVTVNSTKIYLMFDDSFEPGSTFENYRSTDLGILLFFALFLVIANVLWAYSASLIKTVKMKDSSEMNFHLAILLIFISGIHYCFF
jgi:drug/metabolite transporter (DMT)-like permease